MAREGHEAGSGTPFPGLLRERRAERVEEGDGGWGERERERQTDRD